MNQTIVKLPKKYQESFEKILPAEILSLRLSGKSHIIIKSGNEFFVYRADQKNPESTKNAFLKAVGSHKCSDCANFYKDGKLCPKVSDCSIPTCRRYTSSFIGAVKDSKRIEKYRFVIEGIEYFNADREYLIVSTCNRYEKYGESKSLKESERSEFLSKFFKEESKKANAKKRGNYSRR